MKLSIDITASNMAVHSTEAIILKAFNWSESSRTVHFFTKQSGKLPLVDRGGRSLKSRRGRIMPFARILVSYYKSEKEGAAYLSSAETLELFDFGADGTLGRLAYGSAACELLYLLLPEEEAHEDLYEYLISYLRFVNRVEKQFIPGLFTAFLLRLANNLGFHPSLDRCVISGEQVEAFGNDLVAISFSAERGGVVSQACQKPGEYYIDLPVADHKMMVYLQSASLNEASKTTVGFRQAGRILKALTRFLGYQAGIRSDLKSLEFLEKLYNTQLTG